MQRWWGPAIDEDQLEVDYGSTIDERWTPSNGPARMWIYEVDAKPVGLGENYLIDHHLEWANSLGVEHAVGVDYAIGSPADRGKGHGARLIELLVEDALSEHTTATQVVVAPKAANTASRRALESVGLELVEVRHIEGEYPRDGDSAIYAITRERWRTLH